MREIKFRGKRIDNGEWVYGGVYMGNFGKSFVVDYFDGLIEVNPNTLGQYTGLKDKEGNEVYEGDIYQNNENGCIGTQTIENSIGGYEVWCLEYKDKSVYNYMPFSQLDLTDFEVVGNIHDNPELLK